MCACEWDCASASARERVCVYDAFICDGLGAEETLATCRLRLMFVRAGGRAQVVAGSRAETCGMRIGDVILSVNGSASASPKQVSCDMMMQLITENASRASVGGAQLYRNLEKERTKLEFGFRLM
jgi:hypothetical protein